MYPIQRIALVAIVAATLAAPVAAQQNYSQVSPADIQRLQDSVTQAGSEVQQLKSRDASRAGQLQTQLDDLRDEVIYLKVKLRKEGSLQRSEYAGVRDRLDDLRSQATNATPSTGNTAGAAGTTANRAAGGTPTSSTQSSTTRSATSTAATGSQ